MYSQAFYFKKKDFLFSLLYGALLLSISLFVNFYAGTYATENASNPVTDIILSNIPAFQVDGFFIFGPIVLFAFVLFLCLKKPQRLPFTLKSVAFFTLIRSLFVTLTHIGPFPTQISITSKILSRVVFGGDLFFSGHVGLTFLLALLFWESFRLRVFFVFSSIFFTFVVLLGHLHYSIDVLAAFFITYTIYHLAGILFRKDKELFLNGLAE